MTRNNSFPEYNPAEIEPKWRAFWKENNIYNTEDADSLKKKMYILDMFPYPSGAGLHVGHPKGYIATDTLSRMRRMQGYNVLHPMGWDAFGLPAEQYAIKTKTHPKIATDENVARYKEQLEIIGMDYDWSREVNTTDPAYYKWSQWAFLQMYKKGLAYQSFEPINWCPSCQTGLANEDLETDGTCERCGTMVGQKPMRQWVLKITDYAERLLDDLNTLPKWPQAVKSSQENWIGKSEGAEIPFMLKGGEKEKEISVFTTRPDTLFGVTYFVLAPEHALVQEWKGQISNFKEVEAYISKTKEQTTIERTAVGKEKTGVELKGITAINPVNQEEIPVWISDYVLADYGTGAVMAVPAHDERDFAFAKKYELPMRQVIKPIFSDTQLPHVEGVKTVTRKTAVVFLQDKETGEVALLDWREPFENLVSAIQGGVDDGEEYVEAAMREVLEEAGFETPELLVDSNVLYDGRFFAAHKNQNRIAISRAFLFEVNKTEQKEVSEEEKKKHTLVWAKEGKVLETLTVPDHAFAWKQIVEPSAITGGGEMVNSKEFNGLNWEEAKVKITEFAGGEMKTTYKLRDWVFSRQRYWGEPMPLLHSQDLKEKIEKESIKLSFYDQKVWARLKNGTKKIESRILNPDETDRYFGNIKEGGYFCAVNKKTDEQMFFRVKAVYQYKNNKDFFADKEVLAGVYAPNPIPDTLEKLEEGYSVYSDNYVERMNTNGIIAWEIEYIEPGVFPLHESQLPLELPDVEAYEPSGTGESPLATIGEWVNVKGYVIETGEVMVVKEGEETSIPDGKELFSFKRETNTMPQWAGSCWYYLRYMDAQNENALVGKEQEKYFNVADVYVGGMEHATRHLIYARFWHKVLFDIGAVSTNEPFEELHTVGLIMAEDGRKMSKRWGNVVNPNDMVERFGADAFRAYEMFMGPFESSIAWNTDGVVGTRRFLEKVWRVSFNLSMATDINVEKTLHKTIKKVSEDIPGFRFNTAVASMMSLVNEIEKSEGGISQKDFLLFIKVLAPFAPHITEEIWMRLHESGNKEIQQSIHVTGWPEHREELIHDDAVMMGIQVNGKVRDQIEISKDATEDEVRKLVMSMATIKKWVDEKIIKKFIYVPGKIISIVVSDK